MACLIAMNWPLHGLDFIGCSLRLDGHGLAFYIGLRFLLV